NADVLEHRTWVFELKDGDNRIRVVVPDGQITTRGEINYTHAGAIQYEVTIEAVPDVDGNKAIKVTDDGSGARSGGGWPVRGEALCPRRISLPVAPESED